jgi:hypothetical protein
MAILLLVVGDRALGGHVKHTVGIDIEGDLDLRHAASGRWNIAELEYAQQPVVPRHGALALVHLDLHRRPIVGSRGKDLALAGRDGSVALDQFGEHTAHRFDTQRQRSNIERQHAFDFAAQHTALYRGPDHDDFVRVDAIVRLLAEQVADQRLDPRHASLADHQKDLVKLLGRYACIQEGLLAGSHRALDDVFHHLLETRPGEFHGQVLGAGRIGSWSAIGYCDRSPAFG